MVLAKHRQQP